MTFYRRRLPHLQRHNKPHFITFTTYHRWILPDLARDITLECCRFVHQRTALLHVAVVMPDHVHLIVSPVVDKARNEVTPLAKIMSSIKSVSARRINEALGRNGHVWQDQSFDHVIRASEGLDEKIIYALENPVRAGLARSRRLYRWSWGESWAAEVGCPTQPVVA